MSTVVIAILRKNKLIFLYIFRHQFESPEIINKSKRKLVLAEIMCIMCETLETQSKQYAKYTDLV